MNDDHEEEELKVEVTESEREVGGWRFAAPRSSENLLKLVKHPETNGILLFRLFTSYSSGAQKLCRHSPPNWHGGVDYRPIMSDSKESNHSHKDCEMPQASSSLLLRNSFF